jgi:hypothetical protein
MTNYFLDQLMPHIPKQASPPAYTLDNFLMIEKITNNFDVLETLW